MKFAFYTIITLFTANFLSPVKAEPTRIDSSSISVDLLFNYDGVFQVFYSSILNDYSEKKSFRYRLQKDKRETIEFSIPSEMSNFLRLDFGQEYGKISKIFSIRVSSESWEMTLLPNEIPLYFKLHIVDLISVDSALTYQNPNFGKLDPFIYAFRKIEPQTPLKGKHNFTLKVSIKSNHYSVIQLFYSYAYKDEAGDYGPIFSEKNSLREFLIASNDFQELEFDLQPDEPIRFIRLDFDGTREGKVWLEEIKLSYNSYAATLDAYSIQERFDFVSNLQDYRLLNNHLEFNINGDSDPFITNSELFYFRAEKRAKNLKQISIFVMVAASLFVANIKGLNRELL